jgi:hypothetical protein
MGRGAASHQMPLTSLQLRVLSVIASNRSEASHFAGGIVLNAGDDSPRFSHDFDIFHEGADAVAAASAADVCALRAAGYEVVQKTGEWERPSSFRKASIAADGEVLEIDWAADSAFRFFPIVPDPLMGWRLHLFDMATNKALALAARSVTRDYVDILELSRSYPLHVIVWAACGKDPGFNPASLLEMMRRFARINPRQLETIQARQLDPIALKTQWVDISDKAEAEITRLADSLPDTPIGVAFVDERGEPGWLLDDPALRVHAPRIRGCWPTIAGVEPELV